MSRTPTDAPTINTMTIPTDEQRHVNLQVLLDGTDVLWATSRTEFNSNVHGRRVLLESPNDMGARDEETPSEWVPDPRGHWTRL